MSECWNLELILDAYKTGDWHEALELHALSNSSYLLWPRLRLHDISYIGHTLKEMGVDRLVSIGSGTCLLEWILEKATGLKVFPVEADPLFWATTKRPKFMGHIYENDPRLDSLLSEPNSAVLFCYFNSSKAFQGYVKIFKGSVLMVIGPYCSDRHTVPGPFDKIIPEEFKFYSSNEISYSKDFVAFYKRE